MNYSFFPILFALSWSISGLDHQTLWGATSLCRPTIVTKSLSCHQSHRDQRGFSLTVPSSANQFVIDVWKSIYPKNPSALALEPASKRFSILRQRYDSQCTRALPNSPSKCRVCPFTLSDVYGADFATDSVIEQISSVDTSVIKDGKS